MNNVEDLARALEYPWEKWTVFLQPAQRQLVERHYSGPARVSGSAGTGKTIVALHRAVHLAQTNPDARILLATFSDTRSITSGLCAKAASSIESAAHSVEDLWTEIRPSEEKSECFQPNIPQYRTLFDANGEDRANAAEEHVRGNHWGPWLGFRTRLWTSGR